MLKPFGSVAAVFAATGAGFMNPDSAQFWQQRFELYPDPFRQIFTGRILQAWNVVEIVVVQAFIKRLENRFYLGKVPNPACMGINRT